MKTVAFIPVRGGSKSIKDKNIMQIGGKPLIYWTVLACVNSKTVDEVFVSTDSEKIRAAVESFGFDKVQVVSRSPETASDTATSENALIEFCKKNSFDEVIFLQATSPLTKAEDIDGAFKKLHSEKSDSLLSVIKNYQFLWNTNGAPINYDPQKRPRRQDWAGYYIENGAFYISTRTAILSSNCRISGKISFWEMSQATFFEADEPADWQIMEKFL